MGLVCCDRSAWLPVRRNIWSIYPPSWYHFTLITTQLTAHCSQFSAHCTLLPVMLSPSVSIPPCAAAVAIALTPAVTPYNRCPITLWLVGDRILRSCARYVQGAGVSARRGTQGNDASSHNTNCVLPMLRSVYAHCGSDLTEIACKCYKLRHQTTVGCRRRTLPAAMLLLLMCV